MWWIMACGWWSSPAPDPARAAPEPEPEPEPLVVDEEAAAALAAAAALPDPGKDDHLMGLTVFLQADPNAVEAALAVRYPASVAGEGQILHVVSDSAIADELLSVTLFGGAGGEHATLTFLSERGYAASPTAPPPAR